MGLATWRISCAEGRSMIGGVSPLQMHLQRVARALGAYNFRYSSEVHLHEIMGEVLTAAGYTFERERVLDKQNRADFFLDGMVIEVKVDGPLGAAVSQVTRYAQLPDVTCLLLMSTERWAQSPMKEHPAINGKPFHMARLWRQTL